MFKNLTYKKKFIAVLLCFLLLLVASYKKTFKDTIEAKKQLNLVERNLAKTNSSFNELYLVKNEVKYLDNLIGGNSIKPEQVQQKVLDFITKEGQNIDVINISDVHLFSNEDFLVYTNQIELEGNYEDLIRLFYKIEKDFKDSRVVSANLNAKKDYRTKTTNLILTIILQNYEKTK